MNTEALAEVLSKIPWMPLFVLYAAYSGYSHWQFLTSEDSMFHMRTTQLQVLHKDVKQTEAKIEEGKKFYAGLDKKREEIRAMTVQLDQMKATLSEELDTPSFMAMVIAEAKKVGLKVVGMKPGELRETEYYDEQTFELEFNGVFVQLFVFLERLASVEKIIRVDDYQIKSVGSSSAPYVDLSGIIKLKTYRYKGSKADEIAKSGGSAPAPTGGKK